MSHNHNLWIITFPLHLMEFQSRISIPLQGKSTSVRNLSTVWSRDLGLIPGLRRAPGEGHDNPLQCSCLENSMDRGAWWATIHGFVKNWP